MRYICVQNTLRTYFSNLSDTCATFVFSRPRFGFIFFVGVFLREYLRGSWEKLDDNDDGVIIVRTIICSRRVHFTYRRTQLYI